MASVLKVNTLTGVTTAGSIVVTGEGNSTTTNLQQGLAKVWVNFNGSGTVAIRDSYNVSSILDEGTGDYTINFTNSMANSNYNFVGAGQQAVSNINREMLIPGDTAPTESALQLWTSTHGALLDFAFISVSNFGDLA